MLAALNFDDLFAYALARQLRLPLLFKGEDFLACYRKRFLPPFVSDTFCSTFCPA